MRVDMDIQYVFLLKPGRRITETDQLIFKIEKI